MQALVEPARTLRATTNADKAGTELWSEAYALIDTMADGIKAAGAVRRRTDPGGKCGAKPPGDAPATTRWHGAATAGGRSRGATEGVP
ncbi:hypothetical protein [Actinacidiphila glaucinigra]